MRVSVVKIRVAGSPYRCGFGRSARLHGILGVGRRLEYAAEYSSEDLQASQQANSVSGGDGIV